MAETTSKIKQLRIWCTSHSRLYLNISAKSWSCIKSKPCFFVGLIFSHFILLVHVWSHFRAILVSIKWTWFWVTWYGFFLACLHNNEALTSLKRNYGSLWYIVLDALCQQQWGDIKRLVMQAIIYRELWWYSKVLGWLIAGHGMSSEWCSKMPGFVQMSDMTMPSQQSIIIKYYNPELQHLARSAPFHLAAGLQARCDHSSSFFDYILVLRRLPGCGNRVPQWTHPSHDDTWSNSSVRMLEVLQNEKSHEWNTSKIASKAKKAFSLRPFVICIVIATQTIYGAQFPGSEGEWIKDWRTAGALDTSPEADGRERSESLCIQLAKWAGDRKSVV